MSHTGPQKFRGSGNRLRRLMQALRIYLVLVPTGYGFIYLGQYRHSTDYTEYRHSIKHAQHSGRVASLSCVCHSLHWRQIIVPCLLSCQGGSVFVQHYKRVANLACVSHSLHCRHLSNVVGSRVREAARSSRRSSPWLRGKSQPMPFVE